MSAVPVSLYFFFTLSRKLSHNPFLSEALHLKAAKTRNWRLDLFEQFR